MVVGKSTWKDNVTAGLERRVFNGRTFDYYKGVPDNLFSALQNSAANYGEKIFIIDDANISYSYSKFFQDCISFSAFLSTEKGLKKGSHVALMLYNSYEFCVAFLSCIRIGAIVIPLPSKYHQEEILSLCDKSNLDCIVCDNHFSDWFQCFVNSGTKLVKTGTDSYGFSFVPDASEQDIALLPTGAASDPAVIMFTSGTTSKSKGVIIRNYSIMHAIAVYQKTLGITAEDRTIIPIPIYHVTGLIALLGLFLYTGGTIYLHKFFDSRRILETVISEKITFLHASPTVFSLLMQNREEYPVLESIRKLACGSSNMPKEKLMHLHHWMPEMEFHTIYGLTETSSPATIFPTDAAVSPFIGSSGVPIPGLSLKITDDFENELPPNEIGEIWLSGTVVLDSYYHLQTDSLKNGWLDTGDVGYVNPEGYLYIVDRKKDMINRGGEKICSYDVENELYKIEGIIDAAVVGIPDEIYGEVAAAVVKTSPDFSLSEDEIKNILHHQLAKYKVPVHILFLDEIPLTKNSKIDKQKIKKLF